MKITVVKCFLTGNSEVFVKIATDEGICGYGDGTIAYFPKAVAGMVEELSRYLIGQDPRRIEHLWQACFRWPFMRGGPVTSAAISGIDMALWDIKGKALGVPVYQLLGGLTRERVRLYGHVQGRSAQEIAANAKRLAATGVTAIRYRGFHSYDDESIHDHKSGVRQQVEYAEAIRDAIGDDVDLIIECHGRYDPEWAIKLAKETEQYDPFFIEDPIRHENPKTLATVRSQTGVPLAIGERAHSRWDFLEIVSNNLVNYLRPDICHCGGISEMCKIAALAEPYYINLVPHNTQGPLAMAASLHTCFALSNLIMMEAIFVNPDNRRESEIVRPWPKVQDGYALPNDAPGLGIEFDEAAVERAGVYQVRKGGLRPKALDGSVRDW